MLGKGGNFKISNIFQIKTYRIVTISKNSVTFVENNCYYSEI